MFRIFFLFLASLFLVISFYPLANAGEEKSGLSDALVLQVMSKLRPRVKDLKISSTDFVGEETTEELADPLVTVEEARVAIRRGVISGFAEWCGLHWGKKSFEPFMRKMRENKNFSKKKIAYFGALHGYGMGSADASVKKKGECQEDDRQKYKSYLID